MREIVGEALELEIRVAAALQILERGLAVGHVQQVGEHDSLLGLCLGHRRAQIGFRTIGDGADRAAGLRGDNVARLTERNPVAGESELARRHRAIERDASGHPRGILDRRDIDELVAITEEADRAGVEVDRAAARQEQVHETALKDVDLIEAGLCDCRVGSSAQIERCVLAGRRLEQIEREIGRKNTPHSVALAGFRQGTLTIDDDVRAALDRRDDDIDALRGAIERRPIGEVALDQFGAGDHERVQGVGLACAVTHQQTNTCIWLFEKMMGDAAAEHAGGADEENGLGHADYPSVREDANVAVPGNVISRQRLDSMFQSWNDALMLDFADLRAFARIADLGSVSGAARALRLPKSSVSRALVRLEESVGAVLIERSTRHLRMTDAGLLLQRHARRILDDVGEAENAIGGLIGHPQGDLRVSAPFTFAAGPLAHSLPGFLARYPDVRVLLTIDNRVIDLLTEEFDVAIRIGPLADSELIARRLTTLALWPCASPGYLDRHPPITNPADLSRHAIIGHRAKQEVWPFRTASGTSRDVEIETRTVAPEPDVVRTMLLADAGIGVLPDFHAAAAIAAGALVRVLPDHEHRSVDVHALYPSHRSLSAKVRVFIDTLVADLARTTQTTGSEPRIPAARRGLSAG